MTTIWTAGHRDKQPLLLAHCLVNADRAQVKSHTGYQGTSTVSGPYSAETYQAPVGRPWLELMSVDPRGD